MPYYNFTDVRQNKQIKSLQKQVDEIKGEAELKYKDVNFNGAVLPTANGNSSIYLINSLLQGVSPTTRVGSKVRWTSIKVMLIG